MDTEWILSMVGSAVGAGGLVQIFNWRINKRKAKAEAKQDEIENINSIVEGVYKPIIDSLNNRVSALDAEVSSLRGERDVVAKRHEQEIEAIKRDCAEKSESMRKQLVALSIELAKKVDRPDRGSNGKFVKKDK